MVLLNLLLFLNIINIFFFFNKIELLIACCYLFLFILFFEFVVFALEANINKKKSILFVFLYKNYCIIIKNLKDIIYQVFCFVYQLILLYIKFLYNNLKFLILKVLYKMVSYYISFLNLKLNNEVFFNLYLFQFKKILLINSHSNLLDYSNLINYYKILNTK